MEETEIASEVAEIHGIQEIHEEVEEDVMIEMADEMEDVIAEIEVSTVKMKLCWYIGADLTRIKMAVETRETSPVSDLETTTDGEAEAHEKNVSQRFPVRRSLSQSPSSQRRNTQRAEQLLRQ